MVQAGDPGNQIARSLQDDGEAPSGIHHFARALVMAATVVEKDDRV